MLVDSANVQQVASGRHRGALEEIPLSDRWYAFRLKTAVLTIVIGLAFGVVWRWIPGFAVAALTVLSILEYRSKQRRLWRALLMDTSLIAVGVIAVGVPTAVALLPFAYTIASAALLLHGRQLMVLVAAAIGWGALVYAAPSLGFETLQGSRGAVVGVVSTVIFTSFLVGLHAEASRTLAAWMTLQRALAASSRDLLVGRDSAAVDRVVAGLLEATKSDFTYVARNVTDSESGTTGRVIHAAQRGSAIDPKGIPWWNGSYSDLPTYHAALSAGESIVMVASKLTGLERELLEDGGVRSALILPISTSGAWAGSIAFIDRTVERKWTPDEVNALRSAADMIGAVWERDQADTELRTAAARTAALLEAIPDVLMRVDRDGTCIADHQGHKPVRGFSRMVEQGQSIAEVFPRHVTAAMFEALDAALGGQSVEVVEFLPDPSDQETELEARIVPIDGGTEVVIMVRDISERHAAERVLEEALRSKNQFLASVSHELRTPLTAVLGYAQLLHQLEDSHDATSEEIATTISDQATDMSNIVEDLLVAARSELGELSVVAEPVDVIREINVVVEAVGDTGHEIVTPSPNGGPTLAVGDPPRVRQILRNLVTNAIKYGGPRIELSVDTRADRILLEVRDNGEGIPADRRDRVFEPYQREHADRGRTGSIGLGLTISRDLARLMHGDVVYSLDERGSTFTLDLPAAGVVEVANP